MSLVIGVKLYLEILLHYIFEKISRYHCLIQIMAERKNAKAMACSSLQERSNVTLDVPLQGTIYYSSNPWDCAILDMFHFCCCF